MDRVPDIHASAGWLSLRTKLTLWVMVIALVIQVTLSVIVLWYQEKTLGAFFDSRLAARADAVAAEVAARGKGVGDEELGLIAAATAPNLSGEDLSFWLFCVSGEVIASTSRPAPTADEAAIRRVRAGEPRVAIGRRWMPANPHAAGAPRARQIYWAIRCEDGGAVVLCVGSGDLNYWAVMDAIVRVLALSIPIGVVAAGIAGAMIADIATSPLKRLRDLAGTLGVLGEPGTGENAADGEPSAAPMSSEFANLEQDLREARQRVIDAIAAQERFIANVSHEIKTPIAVMLIEAQTIPPDDLTPRARAFTRSVIEEMRRLSRMVESFLTLTKIQSGKSHIEAKQCPVNDVVMDVVASCNKMARQYGVTLVPELAPHESAAVVTGEFDLLNIMLDNLVRNAIRFSPRHQRVVVAVGAGERECTITVRDYGRGVPEEMLEKIFTRFVQAPQETAMGRGHGLGLAIAMGVAELHGGKVSVRNVPPSRGGGTGGGNGGSGEGGAGGSGGCEFTVRLPMRTVKP